MTKWPSNDKDQVRWKTQKNCQKKKFDQFDRWLLFSIFMYVAVHQSPKPNKNSTTTRFQTLICANYLAQTPAGQMV